MIQNNESKERSSFTWFKKAICRHLQDMGYLNIARKILKCGRVVGVLEATCSCSHKIAPLKYRCNLRTCPDCAKLRQERLKKRFLPIFQQFKPDRTNFYYFLTISPQNYEDLEFGIRDIRKNFNKFLRLKYIKERMKGALSIIEIKQTWPGKPQYDKKGKFLYYHNKWGWNIHIHAIVYGRRIDNNIRGHCLKCGQSLMKYDYNNKKYYCKACNSKQIIVKKDSKIVRLWKQSTHQEVTMNVQKQYSVNGTLNYLLKYITSNKEDFNSPRHMALYLKTTHNQRLLSSIGFFYNPEVREILKRHTPLICSKCGSEISCCITFDSEIIELFKKEPEPPPPPSLFRLPTYIK